MSAIDAPPAKPPFLQDVRAVPDLIQRGVIASTGILFTVSMEEFQRIDVTFNMVNSGTAFRFEASNDLVNWDPVPCTINSSSYATLGSTTFTPIMSGTTAQSFTCGRWGAFVRLRCTAAAAGQYQAVASARPYEFKVTEPVGSMWSYTAAAGGIVDTTPVTIRAAGSANVKQCLKSVVLLNTGSASTQAVIADGAALVLARTNLVPNVPFSAQLPYRPGGGGQSLTLTLSSGTTVAVYADISGCQTI